jgi:hypothetical protein
LTRTITNDTASEVTLLECDDASCRHAYNQVTVAAGHKTDVIVEGCGTQTMGIADPRTLVVRGCLTETGDELGEPESALGRRVSEREACQGSGADPFRAQVSDPDH